MRILLIHSDYLNYNVKNKTPVAEEIEEDDDDDDFEGFQIDLDSVTDDSDDDDEDITSLFDSLFDD